jgi:hypothetical protein
MADLGWVWLVDAGGKVINHDKFMQELGFPCVLYLREDGTCLYVQVQKEYKNPDGSVIVVNTTEEFIKAKILMHIP